MTLAVLAAGTLPQSARLSPEEQVGWDTEWEAAASWLDTLGLSQIVGSGWFIGLCVILLINMTAGTLLSIGRKWAFYRGNLKPGYELRGSGVAPAVSPPFFTKKAASAGAVSQLRGAPGLFGLPLFHLGIAVIVLAAFWRGAMDFSDYLELSVGEVFSGQPAKFQRRQPPPEPFDAVIRLDRAEIEVRDGKYMGEFQGHFSYQIAGGPVEEATVMVNHPLRLGDFELYLKESFGYSAWFERLRPDGSSSLLYIHFNAERKAWEKPWSGKKEQLLRFDNIPLHYTMILNNTEPPTFDLTVSRGGQSVFDGRLQPGDVADLGVYKLRFQGMVPWMTFNLTLDRGDISIFVGFVITLLGFLLHLLFWPRRVEWTVTNDGWVVRAWVRRGDDLFEKRWHEWCRQLQREAA
ncbi:MAG: cytochrome c biogenesis protein ResB [Candidatus Polarisedimenticolaceae bacterium]|nr:cytochrome c biogenesis protein ResB [Candidatus Polarisedimenticolaceae bacterium]